MTAMHETDRGPGDYSPPPWDDERRILINIIRRQTDTAGGGNYNEAPKSPSNTVIIGCTATLLCALIIGAIASVNEFSAFRAQVSEWQKSTDRRLDILEHR